MRAPASELRMVRRCRAQFEVMEGPTFPPSGEEAPLGGTPAISISTPALRTRATSTDWRSNRCAVRRVQCWIEIAFGPRLWPPAPGNSAKGLPVMSVSEPSVGLIEKTSIWLPTLSSA